MTTKKRINLSALFIFSATILLFSLGLSHQEIIAFDSRFYLFAQEMLQHGYRFFPTTYDNSYPDYPGTSTWMIVFFAKLFGGLNKTIALLPSIIAAAITLSFTYLIGSLYEERIGWAAVFFLLLTLFFMKTIRSISLDMMVACITTMTFYLIHSSKIKNINRIFWIYPLFIFGFLIRGPIGLVMPAGVMCGYYLVSWLFCSGP